MVVDIKELIIISLYKFGLGCSFFWLTRVTAFDGTNPAMGSITSEFVVIEVFLCKKSVSLCLVPQPNCIF